MYLESKEALRIFHDHFIQYCLEEIDRLQKIVGNIKVPNIPTNSEQALDSASKIPIIGLAANIAILADKTHQSIMESGSEKRITDLVAKYSKNDLLIMLSDAIKIIANSLNDFSNIENRQEIINLAALAKNKLFAYLKTNELEKEEINVEIIVKIIQKQIWHKRDALALDPSSSDQPDTKRLKTNKENSNSNILTSYVSNDHLNTLDYNIDSEIFRVDKIEKRIDRQEKSIQQLQTIVHKSSSSSLIESNEVDFYNIPEAMHYFIGREEELEDMHSYSQKNRNAIQVVGGPGGIGKTQNVLYYISKYKEEYEYRVRWFPAKDKESLDLSFVEFAQTIGINIENKGQDEIIELVKTALASRINHSLLFFDNVNDFELVKEYFPNSGGRKQHHVIITTQNTKDPEDSSAYYKTNIIRLEPFRDEDSIRFVESALKSETRDNALKLANLFNHIPLGLSQSISYIKTNGIDIATYLNEYNNYKKNRPLQLPEDLLSSKFDPHKENIYITLSMTLNRLSLSDPKALNLLKLCSYMNADNIPDGLFNDVFVSHTEKCRALAVLKGYSLIYTRSENDINFIYMHRILQEIVQINTISESSIILQQAMELINKQIVVYDNIVTNIVNIKLFFQHQSSLIDHYNGPLINNELKGDRTNKLNKRAAELYNNYGNTYYILLKLNNASIAYDKSLEIYKIIYGNQMHPNIAIVFSNIGAVHQASKKPHEAMSSYTEVLKIYQKIYPDNNSKLAVIFSKIAYTYLILENTEEALKHYNQALDIYQINQDEQGIADITSSMGKVYQVSKEYDKSLEKLDIALKINIRLNSISLLKFQIISIQLVMFIFY